MLSSLVTTGNEGILPPEEWLASNIPKGGLIGFDPSLLSQITFLKYSKVCNVVVTVIIVIV